MSDKHTLDYITHQMNTLNDQINERYDYLTTKQVAEIKSTIEALWSIVCRRKGAR